MHFLTRLLMVGYTASVVVGLGKWHAVKNVYDYSGSSRFSWSIAYIALAAVSAYGAGLPDAVESRTRRFTASLTAVVAAVLSISVAQLFLGDALLPRFVVFGAAPLLLGGYIVLATAVSHGNQRRGARDRVLLIGRSEEEVVLARDLGASPERPATLLGSIPPPSEGKPASTSIEALCTEQDCSVIVLSREAQNDDELVHEVALLHARGLRIRTLSLFYEEWLGKLPVGELERVSLLFDVSEIHHAGYLRVRRVIDVLLSLLAGVAFIAAVPVVVFGNLVANRGPLFYRQLRVGKNGELFSILKFRTMRPARDGTLNNEWTTEDDPRITPFGKVLRASHLDELPQVVNILRGELTIVGPRPEQPHYVDQLRTKIPFYEFRHVVRPGLTGWAQVKYGYAGSEMDALEKLQYEFFYLRHQSLWFDLRIIGRTLRSVLGRKGR